MPANNERRVNKKAGLGLAAILLASPMVIYYEGVELKTYSDPVGIPTACIGETDKEIVLRESFTRDECLALAGASMAVHATELAKCIEKPIKNNEAAALLSWSYNVGVGAACSSTLVRKLNAGESAAVWCEELKRWDKAGGKVLSGLTKRRTSEFNMCVSGVWSPVK